MGVGYSECNKRGVKFAEPVDAAGKAHGGSLKP